MKRLVIAIDCDDVLVPSTEKIIELYNAKYGAVVKLSDAHTSGNPDWQAPREEVARRIDSIQLSDEYLAAAPFADAIDTCKKLSRMHELHLVTARPAHIMHTTLAMLERYFQGVFREVEHVGIDGSKGQVCQRLLADVLIDDNYKHLESARQHGTSGLLWFGSYPWQAHEPGKGVIRCTDWARVGGEIERISR